MNFGLKQVIIVRTDLKMGKGKIASQVAHASVEGVLKTLKRNPLKLLRWRRDGMKKSVLKVNSEKELLEIKKLADKWGLTTALIVDAGRTQIEPNSKTCLAVGPDYEEKIDKVTGNLKLL